MPLNEANTSSAERAPNETRVAKRHWFALFIWTLIIGVTALRVFVSPGRHSIFPVFAQAGHNWLNGIDMYETRDRDCFRYSPLVGALLTPFALLPDSIGEVLWRLLNATVYLAAVVGRSRVVLSPSLSRNDLGLILLLIIPLSVGCLNNGQSNPLVIGLLLGVMVCVQQDRWNAASLFAAVACFLKVYPIAVVLLLAVLYPRQLIGRFLLAIGLGLGLPFLFQHSGYVLDQYQGWFHHLQASDRTSLPVHIWYRDFRLLCHTFHVPLTSRLYAVVQLAVAAGCAALCIQAKRAGWSRDRLLSFALGLGCCWMTVFGAAAESSTYILLAPSLACALLESFRGEFSRPCRMLVIASFGLFTVTEAAVWFPFGRQFHALGVHAAAGLMLFFALVAMAIPRLRRLSVAPVLARYAH
jgi:hypothetical protein